MYRTWADPTGLGTERGAQPNSRPSRPQGGRADLTASWPVARAVAVDAAKPLPWVEIDIAHACGRALACELRALAPLPAFDSAAMDGWAVRGPGPWRVIGHLLAGNESPGALEHGSAVEIATGTWVPVDADGVLPYETGLLLGSELAGDLPAGLNIRRIGEEFAAGTVVLPTGAMLTPAALGLAAAIGHDRLKVRTRPRVVVLVTGDELLCRGLPGSGRIRDAIGPILTGALESSGGQLVGLEHPGDDAELLCRQIDGADADVVVTTGASSVGPADHLPALLQRLGAQVLIGRCHRQAGAPPAARKVARRPAADRPARQSAGGNGRVGHAGATCVGRVCRRGPATTFQGEACRHHRRRSGRPPAGASAALKRLGLPHRPWGVPRCCVAPR